MENEALEVLYNRRSIRNFTNDKVTGEQLSLIQKAMTLAPNENNEQSWYFVCIAKKDVIEQIELLADQGNGCHGAPLLIVAFGDMQSESPVVNTTFALSQAMIAASSLGLGSCYTQFVSEVFNKPEYVGLKKALNVPGGYFCTGAIVIGVPEDVDYLPQNRKQNVFTIVTEGD